MPRHDKFLEVFWDDELVGHLICSRKNPSQIYFKYADTWLASYHTSISFSLPISDRVYSAESSTNYFRNLVPEGDVYQRLCERAGINSWDIYSFLSVFGRECAGALSIMPSRGIHSQISYAYKDISDELENILARAKFRSGSLILAADTRLSIAGAQDKLPVHIQNGRFLVPNADDNSFAPTSAIMKLPTFKDLHRNEAFCMALAQKIGLTVPKSWIIEIGEEQVFIVERYDRECIQDSIHRIHQEDFCQAFGLNNKEKYEYDNGPGFKKCCRLVLSPNMKQPDSSRTQFVACAVFNYIIGNCDAHAKNFSLLYPHPSSRHEQCGLAPFYDLLSTRVYPHLSDRFAMKIGKNFRFDHIDPQSWRVATGDFFLRTEKLQDIMTEVAGKIEKYAESTASEQIAAYGHSDIYESILSVIESGIFGIKQASESLQAGIKLNMPALTTPTP